MIRLPNMRIIRGVPATGKVPMCTCTGCGKRRPEAGIACAPDAVEKAYSSHGTMLIVDDSEHDTYPLCISCVDAFDKSVR